MEIADKEAEPRSVEEEAEEEEAVAAKPKKKISAIIDTDSEEEPQKDEEIEPDLKTPTKEITKHKLKGLVDTDSELEEQTSPKPHKKKSKKGTKKQAGRLGDGEDLKQDPNKDKPSKKTKKKKQRMDSNSEQEEHKGMSDEETSPMTSNLKGLVDSESEPELSSPEKSAGEQEPAIEAAAGKPKKPKVVRESAKKALQGMQAIQSEQQRLHREAHINVPYHQPKPRSLKEFLARRTINAPLATALAGGSPMPNKQPRKSVGLRMASEDLEAFAKLMEARAQEATEFFKSESEPEEEEESEPENVEEEPPVDLKDNPDVMDDVSEIQEEPKDQLEEPASEPMEEKALTEEEPIASTSAAAGLKENQLEVDNTSPTKVRLVTEVVELPKLDLSTISITPPSKPATPKISEAIRRLKIEKSTDVSPSLKGDASMVIDLETGDMFAKKPTGVDDLLQRLMKTREAKKHKTSETVNILTTEHGKLEMSKVNFHLHEEEPVSKEPKPGAGYIKMQEHLKTLITKKRMEELRKRQAEEEQERAADDEDMEVDEDEEYEPENKPGCAEVTINDEEEILEEGEGMIDEDAEEVVDVGENQEEDREDVEERSSESEVESEAEAETEPPVGRKKNRIIQVFQDDNSSDDDDLDLLQTPKPSGAPPITATQLQLSAQKLFDAETHRTASDEENELLDLCSGQFPQTQMHSSAAPSVDTAVISQIPMTQLGASSQDAPDELESLCSGTFATQLPTQKEEFLGDSQPHSEVANKIVSSDEEETKDEVHNAEKPRTKKLTKKRQKKKAKLGFSDDEESDEEEEEEVGEESDECEEPAEDIPETFVDYDSEENEIVVEMNKKERKMRAANFVEKEAELSESEWGSADEDEKNMDAYDIELGDEDQFDREKLRTELGQIHARKMLDQDIREVRKIQDMLFEDEEGAVRQRQFRWKNAENGFSLEDQRPENGEANEGSGDEENEHLWRKIRYEREQLLLEKGLKVEAASPLGTSMMNSSSTPGSSIRRLNIVTAKKTTVEMKKNSPFLISKTVTGNKLQQKSAVRGSFLVRDQETLTKLAAGLTKGSAADASGEAGTVSVKTAKAKNFVFATLTEEEHENQKRKAADLLNSSSETGVNFMKKPRLEPRRDKCLIDQLL
ncbi:hypothetical protein KR054_008789 [Drosophila jambulina]|nr:hypothetical protein KR054_008789 [Drosophila jambulina]